MTGTQQNALKLRAKANSSVPQDKMLVEYGY